MTTINDISDLVRILQDNPAWAEAVRSVLLSRELLNLPEEFANFAKTVRENSETVNRRLERLEGDVSELKAGQSRLEGDVTELKAGQARLEGDVSELKAGYARLEEGQARLEGDVSELKAGQARLEEGQARLEQRQSEMQTGMNRMRGEIGYLAGSNFQRQAITVISRVARNYFGLQEATLVQQADAAANHPLSLVLNEAADNDSVDFTDEDAIGVELADAVVFGRDQDGNDTYLLMEASVTVMDDDVERARERADLLERATGAPTKAVVVGAEITETATQLAEERQVTFVPFNPRAARPLAWMSERN